MEVCVSQEVASNLIAFVPVGISLIAVVVSVVTLIKQGHDSRRDRDLVTLTERMREFRSDNFQAHRFCVENIDSTKLVTDERGFLDDTVWKDLRPVLHYYDNLGMMMAFGLVDERPILAYVGVPIMRTWSAVADFVKERRKIQPDYLKFFGHAAARAHAARSTALKSLSLQTP